MDRVRVRVRDKVRGRVGTRADRQGEAEADEGVG